MPILGLASLVLAKSGSFCSRQIMTMLKADLFKTLFSGFVPAIILAMVGYITIRRTTEQLGILHEQISYMREPVIHVEARPIPGVWHPPGKPEPEEYPFMNSLYLSNVGNDTLENVSVNLSVYLVTNEKVYSYGQKENLEAFFTDTTRTPRQRIWPRLVLFPDSNEIDLSSRLILLCLRPHLDGWERVDIRQDVYHTRKVLDGDFVLMAECYFRRKSDFVQYADTFYFAFDGLYGPDKDLTTLVGGPGIVDRITAYLHSGPEVSINFRENRYEIYTHKLGPLPASVDRLPRNPNH